MNETETQKKIIQLDESLLGEDVIAQVVAKWEASKDKVSDEEMSKAYWKARRAFERIESMRAVSVEVSP